MLVVIGLLNYTRKSSFTLLSYLSIPTEIIIEPKFFVDNGRTLAVAGDDYQDQHELCYPQHNGDLRFLKCLMR